MPATYRFEVAKQGRAGCQSATCKHEGLKIDKGELRMGSLVEMRDYTTWKWKHWGCVTPLQIGNILEQLGGLDGLDIDSDLDILDGYDEIPDWAQNKIKFSLQNGHVEDTDWKGDPELNRPGMKGLHKRTPKKNAADNDDAEDDEVADQKPKKGRGKKRPTDEDDDQATTPVPKIKTGRKRKTAPTEEDEADVSPSEKPKRKPRSKKPKVEEADDDVLDDQPLPKPKRATKGKKIKTEDTDVSIEQINTSTNGMAEAPATTTSRGRKPKASVEKPVKAPRGRPKVKKEESDIETVKTPIPAAQKEDSTKAATQKPRGRGRRPKVKMEENEVEDELPAEANNHDDDDEDVVDMKTKQTNIAKARSRGKAK